MKQSPGEGEGERWKGQRGVEGDLWSGEGTDHTLMRGLTALLEH